MKKTIILLGMLFFMGGIAYGNPIGFSGRVGMTHSDNGLRRGPGSGPPPEAFTACENKKEGERAQFTDANGVTLTGTCLSDGNRLVLRPDHPPADPGCRQHTPPPEAYKACEGKKAGDTSSLVDPRGETLRGTCEKVDGKLVLRPEHPRDNQPPPGEDSSTSSENDGRQTGQ